MLRILMKFDSRRFNVFWKNSSREKKDSKNEANHHCRIVVSRKTMNGKIRISPMTYHINTYEGAVKGGFDIKDF